MEDFTEYTMHEFNRRYQKIKQIAVDQKEPVEKPEAVILGGQPGAGKSSMIKHFESLIADKGTAVISGDDFRKLHPHFDHLYAQYGDDYVNYTQKFSSQVIERLIDELSREKYNLIIEGTLRTSAVPIRTAELLKSRGYHVELAVMAVPPILSYVGTIERYERMKEIGTTPRMTTKLQHDNTVNAIVESIEKVYKSGVFDDISLQNRKSECLYRMTDTPDIHPGTVLQHEHNRNITAEESSYLDNVVEYIEDRWNEHSGVSADEPEVLTEMRVQVAYAQFKTALSENGLRLIEAVLDNLSELVKSTGRIWKLEDIAQAYTKGGNINQYISEIGNELKNQQLEMMETQPEI